MGEVRPDGRLVYSLCIVIVPRRAGKTRLILPTCVQRATMGPGHRAWYTAQTQSDAEDTFREEWTPLLEHSALAPFLRLRQSNGSKRVTLDTGGRVGVFAPTEKALHGKDADYAVVDEAWAFDAARGAQLEAAIRPTMATRPHRQLVVISAGGTEASTWLLAWRAYGRRLVEENRCEEAGVFYLEFYPPGELDPRTGELVDLDSIHDPDVWAATHPAVGHTIDLDFIAHEYRTLTEKDDLAQFARSYLDVFTSAALERVIPAAAWKACQDPAAVLPARVRIGYDVEHGGDTGAIVAAARRPDGRPGAELLWTGPVDAMADRLQALRDAGHRLGADSVGPVAVVTAELRRRGITVDTLDTTGYTTACQELLTLVKGAGVVVRADARMDTAAANAAKRDVGDAWAWTRKRSGAGVSPVVAATVAVAHARRGSGERLGMIVG